MPESVIHLCVREFLHQLLRYVLSGRAFVGSEQFVYYDGSDPRRCVAPDVYTKWGDGGARPITSWKTWERGTPELCIEIDSPGDDGSWSEKLDHYRSIGVRELVRFDPDAVAGKRIRVWDRIDDDLVERVVERDCTPCITLGMHWVVRSIEEAPVALRLATSESGESLAMNEAETQASRALNESRRAQVEAQRAQVEASARVEAERARDAASRRIAELEEELRRRGT